MRSNVRSFRREMCRWKSLVVVKSFMIVYHVEGSAGSSAGGSVVSPIAHSDATCYSSLVASVAELPAQIAVSDSCLP